MREGGFICNLQIFFTNWPILSKEEMQTFSHIPILETKMILSQLIFLENGASDFDILQ